MKYTKFIGLLTCAIFIFTSCDDCEVDETNSSGVVTEFQALFQSLVNSGHDDKVSFDTEIHEFTFTLSQDEEVCKIGYQSYSDIEDRHYLIEIEDKSNGSIIYSYEHTFSSSNTSYVKPSATILLDSGIQYTIRRIQTDWDPYITNTIGRIAVKDSMEFPYNLGILTINSADFYQNGGPLTNQAVPFIDLVFKD